MIRLVRRVEVPIPTMAGWGLVGSAVAVVAITFVATVYPFLAVNQPIGSGSLVVEGWMNRESVMTAIELFESEGYDRIYTTGDPSSPDPIFRFSIQITKRTRRLRRTSFSSRGSPRTASLPYPACSFRANALTFLLWLCGFGSSRTG